MTAQRIEPRPEVVFLDLGDTMVRAHPSWADVYAQAYPEFGVDVTREHFDRAFSEAFEDEPEGPFEASKEASFARLKELDGRAFAKLGYPDLPDEFFRAVEENFAQRTAWWVFPDTMPALDAMRSAGLRLAVISNWSWQAPELLHDLELASHFEALVVSDRIGYQKPHRRIFEHALELMGTRPEQAVHVGDSVRADVEGARGAGIQPILIDRDDRGAHDHAQGQDGPSAPVIHDLFGLLDLLGVPRPAVSAAS